MDKFTSFLTAVPWLCEKCGINNHGWNKKCVGCWVWRGIVTKRPYSVLEYFDGDNWVELNV